MKKITLKLLFVTLFVSAFTCAYAQEGTYSGYSPYSVYGIGDLSNAGNAYTKSMGGIGIANRNKRFINPLNPAAISARDTLSFMADFGFSENNKYLAQNAFSSANNTFNINDFILSFPIWKSSAFMVGIAQYSDVGYDFSSIEEDPAIIGNTGNISYNAYGQGGIYQVFAGASATFWKRLSIGAEAIYYFGTIDKVTNTEFSKSSYRTINAGYTLQLRGFTGKFGIQYEQRLGSEISVVLGATYKPSTNMKGYSQDYSYAVMSELTDTLRNNDFKIGKESGLRFGDEIGVGLSLKGGDKWAVEFDYTRSNWHDSGFDTHKGFMVNGSGISFSSVTGQSFRAGFEFVPNRNDIRYYYKRISYRAGLYHEQSYYALNGKGVTNSGITIGLTLPVFRWYNGISLGVDLGQRGSMKNDMVRERYINFNVGFNLHDIWFQKPRYN